MENEEPNEVTYAAMEDAEKNENMHGPFHSVEELFAALNSDDEEDRDERNAAYLQKLDRGLSQVRTGQGITKTIEELEHMSSHSDGNTIQNNQE